MANPVVLVRQDTGKAAAYACSVCPDLWTTEARAEQCCRCCDCRSMVVPGGTRCSECAAKHDDVLAGEIRRHCGARFEKAKKVPAREYEGPVYWDDHGPSDGHFESIEMLQDYCESRGDELPAYVWATKQITLRMHADAIVDSALDDHHDDAGDKITYEEQERLQAMLDDWCEAQCITSYTVDYSTAVML